MWIFLTRNSAIKMNQSNFKNFQWSPHFFSSPIGPPLNRPPLAARSTVTRANFSSYRPALSNQTNQSVFVSRVRLAWPTTSHREVRPKTNRNNSQYHYKTTVPLRITTSQLSAVLWDIKSITPRRYIWHLAHNIGILVLIVSFLHGWNRAVLLNIEYCNIKICRLDSS